MIVIDGLNLTPYFVGFGIGILAISLSCIIKICLKC